MAAAEIDYTKLEAFLKGDVSLEDLEARTNRFSRYDKTAIAYALVFAHRDELTYSTGDEYHLENALDRTLNKYCPFVVGSTHVDVSRKLGLHEWRGRGYSSILRLPDRFIELVNRYKDMPEGGIAKFTALKQAQDRADSGGGTITPEGVALDVVARLRRTYSEEVLAIIRQAL